MAETQKIIFVLLPTLFFSIKL